MTRKRKHMPSIPNGRFLRSVALERILYGEPVPDTNIRAARQETSAGAEAKSLMAKARGEYERQKGAA